MSAAAAPEQSTANDASASTMPSIALLATKQAAKIEAEQAATAVAPRLSPPRASSSSDNALALDRLARAASSAQQHASSPTAFLANTKCASLAAESQYGSNSRLALSDNSRTSPIRGLLPTRSGRRRSTVHFSKLSDRLDRAVAGRPAQDISSTEFERCIMESFDLEVDSHNSTNFGSSATATAEDVAALCKLSTAIFTLFDSEESGFVKVESLKPFLAAVLSAKKGRRGGQSSPSRIADVASALAATSGEGGGVVAAAVGGSVQGGGLNDDAYEMSGVDRRGDSWVCVRTPASGGLPYWYNRRTSVSSWTPPLDFVEEAAAQSQSVLGDQPAWTCLLDPSTNAPYWFNRITCVSQWSPPPPSASALSEQKRMLFATASVQRIERRQAATLRDYTREYALSSLRARANASRQSFVNGKPPGLSHDRCGRQSPRSASLPSSPSPTRSRSSSTRASWSAPYRSRSASAAAPLISRRESRIVSRSARRRSSSKFSNSKGKSRSDVWSATASYTKGSSHTKMGVPQLTDLDAIWSDFEAHLGRLNTMGMDTSRWTNESGRHENVERGSISPPSTGTTRTRISSRTFMGSPLNSSSSSSRKSLDYLGFESARSTGLVLGSLSSPPGTFRGREMTDSGTAFRPIRRWEERH